LQLVSHQKGKGGGGGGGGPIKHLKGKKKGRRTPRHPSKKICARVRKSQFTLGRGGKGEVTRYTLKKRGEEKITLINCRPPLEGGEGGRGKKTSLTLLCKGRGKGGGTPVPYIPYYSEEREGKKKGDMYSTL